MSRDEKKSKYKSKYKRVGRRSGENEQQEERNAGISPWRRTYRESESTVAVEEAPAVSVDSRACEL